ncbi:MAG: DNA repair protein RecN [Chloroflexota bacterium]
MLTELKISNFAIIDEVHLKFQVGFNVLTGETGAGKSIIIDAVNLLLGGRSASDFVRAGTDAAYVEGLFTLSDTMQKQITPILEQEGLEDETPDTLLLSREIRANGRSFCRVNGRAVNVSLLEIVASPLVDIHGQHHHLSLLQVKQHQAFLDRFGGLDRLRQKVAKAVRTLNTSQQELQQLQDNAQQIARRVDQLTFQVDEIRAAALKPNEEEALATERTRLSNAEKLSQTTSEAHRLLVDGVDEQPSVSDLIDQVVQSLTALQRIDESVVDIFTLAENVNYQIEDLSGQLQAYGEEIEFNPDRLIEVEERLTLIYNLKRKYGDSIEDVLAFGEQAETELKSISRAEDRIQELQIEVEALRHSVGKLAADLSEKRLQAGRQLGQGVERELKELGMERTEFVAELKRLPDPNGVYIGEETFACDENGVDQVEFLIAPNPGEPLKPMIKIASGGETSRLMLALKTVLAIADDTPTLIFDEIDQGIGGRIGGVVGQKLWGLATQTGHQVLCITHLAQIAAFGDRHYHVAKNIEAQRTTTRLELIDGDRQINELAQMVGVVSEATRLSATDLLGEAKQFKTNRSAVVEQASLL